mgnify:CR=1 FL=1
MGIDCGSLGKSNTLDGLRGGRQGGFQESRDSGPGRRGAVVETGLPIGRRAFNLSGPPGVGTPRGPEEQ